MRAKSKPEYIREHHLHLKLNSQPPIDRRHGVPNTAQQRRGNAPLEGSVHGALAGFPRGLVGLFVFGGVDVEWSGHCVCVIWF